MNDFAPHYYALTLTIIGNYTIDDALEYIESGKRIRKHDIKRDETEQMIELHNNGEGLSEIGRLFGMSGDAVYQRLKRHRNRKIN
jgi:DNA invertase Pin-like site-specific DNA recombinase